MLHSVASSLALGHSHLLGGLRGISETERRIKLLAFSRPMVCKVATGARAQNLIQGNRALVSKTSSSRDRRGHGDDLLSALSPLSSLGSANTHEFEMIRTPVELRKNKGGARAEVEPTPT